MKRAPKNESLGSAATLGHERIGIDIQSRVIRDLHHRDQRGDGGERELEADAEKGLLGSMATTARTAKARLRMVSAARRSHASW